MLKLSLDFTDIAWPLTIFVAWFVGEIGHRLTHAPRISFYGIVGFIFANQPWLPALGIDNKSMLLLANIAFGLILFECGHSINLRWLQINPWLSITAVLESFATFAAVYGVTSLSGVDQTNALLLASLAMATSPAGVLRVVNDERSAGQVTERILHLAAFNSMLAVITFKIIVGWLVFKSSGNLSVAIYNTLLVSLVSLALGTLLREEKAGFWRRQGSWVACAPASCDRISVKRCFMLPIPLDNP